jgi:hypothetical protein
VARRLDDGKTLEVLRVYTDGMRSRAEGDKRSEKG